LIVNVFVNLVHLAFDEVNVTLDPVNSMSDGHDLSIDGLEYYVLISDYNLGVPATITWPTTCPTDNDRHDCNHNQNELLCINWHFLTTPCHP